MFDYGLTVTGDKVLVRPYTVEKKTESGIILSDTTADREGMAQQLGVLVGFGTAAAEAPEMQGLELGDTVIFPKYQQAEFVIDGVKFWVLRASSILGKCTKIPDFALKGALSSMETFDAQKAA